MRNKQKTVLVKNTKAKFHSFCRLVKCKWFLFTNCVHFFLDFEQNKQKHHSNKTRYKAGKISFSGERKSVLLKASSGESCAPRNFVLLVTLRSKSVCLTGYLTVHQIK